jgi:hypothetical protein
MWEEIKLDEVQHVAKLFEGRYFLKHWYGSMVFSLAM